MHTEETTDKVTSTIEKMRYFEMSGMAEALFGVMEETRPRKKVSARRTEMESVIFSPPMFGWWKTEITIEVIIRIGRVM